MFSLRAAIVMLSALNPGPSGAINTYCIGVLSIVILTVERCCEADCLRKAVMFDTGDDILGSVSNG
jgi:hypothetical protein